MSTIDKFLQEVLSMRTQIRDLQAERERMRNALVNIANEAKEKPATGHIAVLAIRALEGVEKQ